MPASGGGFRVEPAAIRSGSGALNDAASASAAYASSVAMQGSIGGDSMGVGPLAGALGALGAKLDMASARLAGSLSGAAATLEASAAAYARSDRPLAGGP